MYHLARNFSLTIVLVSLDIFVNTSTGMLKDSSNWQIGKPITITGFSSQYGTEYECDPRVPSDLIVKKD
jgi:hypothetical protein